MNRITSLAVSSFVLVVLTLVTGCQLETIAPPPPPVNAADHIVINEVFTLARTEPAPYSWIELYNPTPDTINLVGWTLNFYTNKLNRDWVVTIDTLGNIVGEPQQIITIDTTGAIDVPFAEAVVDFPGVDESILDVEGIDADTVRLPPGGLYTLVNFEDRMLDHIQWGPGDERFTFERPIIQGIYEFGAVVDSTDSTKTQYLATEAFEFFFQPTDQIILKDTSGNVVDVVRYGNYQYTGPMTNDPFPNNISIGMMPLFQSIQRFARAYHTGNTANDFYLSSSQIVPTPQWYNQVNKP